jgi:hypothetical protein
MVNVNPLLPGERRDAGRARQAIRELVPILSVAYAEVARFEDSDRRALQRAYESAKEAEDEIRMVLNLLLDLGAWES